MFTGREHRYSVCRALYRRSMNSVWRCSADDELFSNVEPCTARTITTTILRVTHNDTIWDTVRTPYTCPNTQHYYLTRVLRKDTY